MGGHTCNLHLSFLIGFFVFLPVTLPSQTCCSGGVPLSSNLGLPPSFGNTIQFTLSYDLNVLQTLQAGTEQLDDDSRSRRTHSVLLELGYSFSDRFSVDGFFSWVRQERKITQFGNTNVVSTEGIGDAVLLFKYKALATQHNTTVLTTGIGLKAPLGASDLRRSDGLPIVADLQPGSGAWDGILWGQFTHVTSFRPTMSITATATYGIKGTNDSYLGSQEYQFGDELQIAAGLSDRLLIGSLIIDPSIVLRYRTVTEDVINDQTVPNTGGSWLFINPGFSYWIKPDLSFNANVSVPLYDDITGTQVTPTFRINTGLFYRLSLNKKDHSINPLR